MWVPVLLLFLVPICSSLETVETTTTSPQLSPEEADAVTVTTKIPYSQPGRILKQNRTIEVVEDDEAVPGWLELPADYNKEEIPMSHNPNEALKVFIFINIRGINSIDLKAGRITLDMDMYMFWADHRFHGNRTSKSRNKGSASVENGNVLIELQKLHPDFVRKIWVPDIYMENCIIVPHHDLTSEPLVSFNSETGFTKYSRMEVTVPCPMSFFYYPFDIQQCNITVRSYRHLSNHLDLEWVHTGGFLGAVRNPNFDIKVDSVTRQQRVVHPINLPNIFEKVHLNNVIWKDRTFDVLTIAMRFRSNLSFHLAQTYLPSTFFIIITWLCFLLPPSMAASRVGITMTTLLTINTMFNSVRDHSPQVSYAKAIDIWMVACIMFDFLALLEFAFMSWLEMVKEREEKRKKEHDEEEKKILEVSCKEYDADNSQDKLNGPSIPLQPYAIPHIKRMDPQKLKRLLWIRKFLQNHGLTLISGLFILFNAVYWCWVSTASEYFHWVCDPRFNEEIS